jgi:anti-anti-sigma factor
VPLDITSSVQGDRARITLKGSLDGASADAVRRAVDVALESNPAWLELDVEHVSFMASAGLRVLIFAKQKRPALKIAIIKPQAPIVDTLKKTGFLDSVYVTDEPQAPG